MAILPPHHHPQVVLLTKLLVEEAGGSPGLARDQLEQVSWEVPWIRRFQIIWQIRAILTSKFHV